MVGATLAVTLLMGASGISVPTDPEHLRQSLFSGDLVTVDRGEALLRSQDVDVTRGELGLLFALGRFVRCRDPGEPVGDAPSFTAARMLLRYEALRLAQLVYDGRNPELALATLLQRPYRTTSDDRQVVRWPVSSESWSDELPSAAPRSNLCPRRPGIEPRSPHARARDQSQRAALAALIDNLAFLPDEVAAGLAHTYLKHAAAARSFSLEAELARRLRTQVGRGPAAIRTSGRFWLADLNPADASPLWQEILQDTEASAAAHSRARVLLAVALEPDWPRIRRVTTSTAIAAARPGDRVALTNSRVRALFALGRSEELMTTGRRLLRAGGRSALHNQSVDILLELASSLPAPQALAWMEEIAAADQRVARHPRFMNVAQRALTAGRFDLARAIYDRLRTDLSGRLRKPRQAALLSELLRARAEVAYEEADVEGFGGLLDSLVARATADAARPLARHAPHRALAALTQSLIGRLVERRGQDAKQRLFAAHLLEAAAALPRSPRHQRALASYTPTLTETAGEYARGRLPRRPRRSGRALPPVKRLGEVVLRRLPPRLPVESTPLPVPFVDAQLVYQNVWGVWRAGVFWPQKS